MALLIALLFFVFIVGLCIGSFLNVVILRALSNESIVFPASKCPKCQTPLKWWHNIPVISYICLGGKCAFCKEKISIQYPITELITAVLFTLEFLKFGLSINLLFVWIITALLIVIAGTDIKEKVVFDAHTFSLIGAGIIYALVITVLSIVLVYKSGYPVEFNKEILFNLPIVSAILGGIAGALILEFFARLGYVFVGTRAFGEGDTLIAAGLGAVFGWKVLFFILLLSVVIQVIMFMPMFLKGLVCNKEWKTLISFLSFTFYALIFVALQHYEKLANIYTFAAIILAVLGITTCVFILKDLRNNPQNRTYLPFGPALVIAGLITMFLIH